MTTKKRILSGMRPTGKLHLGHLVGALGNWVRLQDSYDCFYMVADWHAFMSEYEKPKGMAESSIEMVRDFVAAAGAEIGMALEWRGSGVDEKGYDVQGNCIVQVDPRYFRPTEVETLLGDATKAREKLGWTPRTTFAELVAEMVREDLKAAERDELIKKHGYQTMDRHE